MDGTLPLIRQPVYSQGYTLISSTGYTCSLNNGWVGGQYVTRPWDYERDKIVWGIQKFRRLINLKTVLRIFKIEFVTKKDSSVRS